MTVVSPPSRHHHDKMDEVTTTTAATVPVTATTTTSSTTVTGSTDSRNRQMAFTKMEKLVREMQHPETGVPVRSQKTFLTSLPCVFMGYDLIEWLMERLTLEDSAEAIHLANLLSHYGYFFPVPDSKTLLVKDDGSYYRFQTPYFWPSQHHNPDSTEYAIYLVKRSMRNKQKHGLDECEQETLAKLKKNLSHKWEFVTMQAEDQLKLAKERKKMDKIVVDSQERAYWRVHWSPPGVPPCLESCPVPVRPTCARKAPATRQELLEEITRLQEALSRTRMKVSHVAESLLHHCSMYADYDPQVVGAQPSNPWVTDDTTFWAFNVNMVSNPTERRIRRWAITINDLLVDPTGIHEFESYLHKEYSHENIRFWKAVRLLHATAKANVERIVRDIYHEFLCPGAPCEVNLDSRTVEGTQQAMKCPTRFTFDAAQMHVYSLMKKDSYPRYLRSDAYKNLLMNAAQPSQKKRFFNFGGAAKKKNSPSGGGGNTLGGGGGGSGKGRGSNSNLSGSTNDLRPERDDGWPSGLPNVIGHSLSASNLHDLDAADASYRLSSPSGKDKGPDFFKGDLKGSKPKALSTESCNNTAATQEQRGSAELTLEVPSKAASSAKSAPAVVVPRTYNDVCPWEDMELPTKSHETGHQ